VARANKRERARGRGAPELSAAELEHLLAEYNAWAGVWNLHETSPDLPLGPRPVGFEISLGWVPRRVYVTRHGDTRSAVIYPHRAWHMYGRGWSCTRNTLEPGQVRRAVWVRNWRGDA
jgi:hypothetical protein